MSKFCTKCGAACDDNTAFCTSCGAKFDAAPAQQAQSAQQAQANNAGGDKSILDKFKENATMDNIKNLSSQPNFTKIVGIAVVAVAALIILIIIFSIAGSGWKKPVKNFFNGIEDTDAETFIKSMCEAQVDGMEKAYKGSDTDFDEAIEKRLENTMDYLEDELGKDVKISFKITDKDKLSDKKLDDIKDSIKETYNAKGIKVTKGYELEIDYTIKGDDDKDKDDGEMVVAKVDGKWCLYSYDFDGILKKAGI